MVYYIYDFFHIIFYLCISANVFPFILFLKGGVFINLYDILNAVDNILEKSCTEYKDSFADRFIDELKFSLNKTDSLAKLKELPSNTLFTLDRYEGDYAICENRETGEMVDIPRLYVDPYAKEGHILKREGNSYVIDFEATEAARKAIRDVMG